MRYVQKPINDLHFCWWNIVRVLANSNYLTAVYMYISTLNDLNDFDRPWSKVRFDQSQHIKGTFTGRVCCW